MNLLRKTLIAGVALGTLATAVAVNSAPASARGFGFGWGMAGVATGLALGAATAAADPYYGHGYGDCYVERQPIYDDYGNYMGSHHVRVCD